MDLSCPRSSAQFKGLSARRAPWRDLASDASSGTQRQADFLNRAASSDPRVAPPAAGMRILCSGDD
jgi:hypothetical protein